MKYDVIIAGAGFAGLAAAGELRGKRVPSSGTPTTGVSAGTVEESLRADGQLAR